MHVVLLLNLRGVLLLIKVCQMGLQLFLLPPPVLQVSLMELIGGLNELLVGISLLTPVHVLRRSQVVADLYIIHLVLLSSCSLLRLCVEALFALFGLEFTYLHIYEVI